MSDLEPVRTEFLLLLGRPLAQLHGPLRTAITAWLVDHEIDPVTLSHAHPIERDPSITQLGWYYTDAYGNLQRSIRYRGINPPGTWPAPFPDVPLT